VRVDAIGVLAPTGALLTVQRAAGHCVRVDYAVTDLSPRTRCASSRKVARAVAGSPGLRLVDGRARTLGDMRGSESHRGVRVHQAQEMTSGSSAFVAEQLVADIFPAAPAQLGDGAER